MFSEIDAYETIIAVSQPDEEIDPAVIATHGIYKLQDQRFALMDKHLDNDMIDDQQIIMNINEMVKADLPLIKFPESQMLVDADLVKEAKTS